jgi:hypothetical protein
MGNFTNQAREEYNEILTRPRVRIRIMGPEPAFQICDSTVPSLGMSLSITTVK